MEGHIKKINSLPPNVTKLSVWDIDDTLLDSKSIQELKIFVYDRKGNITNVLSTQEFNSYKLKPGEVLDERKSYTRFRDASLLAKAKAVSTTLSKARKEVSSSSIMVLTLSARSKMNDKNIFLKVFKNVFGLDLHTRTSHAVFAGEIKSPGPIAKAKVIDDCLKTKRFNNVCMYDDHKENLIEFKKLKAKYKEIKFEAYLVKNGIIIKF